VKHLPIILFFVLSCFSSAAQNKIKPISPDSIIIADNSWAFTDAYAYKYVLVRGRNSFALYQTYKYVRNKKGEKKSFTKKQIGVVPFDGIAELTMALVDTAFSHLRLENFGYNPQLICL
jgi:hypothetical protein